MNSNDSANDEVHAPGDDSRGGRTANRDFETAIDRIDRMNRTVFQQIIERRFPTKQAVSKTEQ